MSRHKGYIVFTSIIATGLAVSVQAADTPAPPPAPEHPKKMKMDEPMSTGMMKKDMKKGDVKKAAEKKSRALQPMMEQEQKSMPPRPAN